MSQRRHHHLCPRGLSWPVCVPQIHVCITEAPAPSVAVLGDGALKEGIKAKGGHRAGP